MLDSKALLQHGGREPTLHTGTEDDQGRRIGSARRTRAYAARVPSTFFRGHSA